MANDIKQIGLQGMLSGLQQAAAAAERLSTAFTTAESSDAVVTSIVDLRTAKLQVQSSAAVIRVGEELDKETLRILA